MSEINFVLFRLTFKTLNIFHQSIQASEDARKLVDEERAFARAEIEAARAAVQKVEEALQEHEQMSRASGKQVCVFCLLQPSGENFSILMP